MPGTLKSYLLGFVLSLLITLLAFFTVAYHLLDQRNMIIILFGLAFLQAFVQLILFLHLGKEEKPRWHLLTFLFMAFVLLLIVIGSLKIMANLNYRERYSLVFEMPKQNALNT